MDAIVLAEPGQQQDALLEHAIPGIPVGVVQVLALAGRPFRKQGGSGILTPKQGGQRLFEGAPEQHRRAGIFLLPAIEVAIAIPPRAGKVLADLGVAVGHQATCGLSRFAGESSSQRPAGAKPSSRRREAPLSTTWLILTTPFRPTSCLSSTSSLPSSSVS